MNKVFKKREENTSRKRGASSRDALISVGVLAACSLIGFFFYFFGLSEANIISIYILGILLIASLTSRRIYGVVSSVVGVLLFNCLYAEPRFTLLVYDWQYAITTAVMLFAALATNYIVTETRDLRLFNERVAREAEAERLRANLLRAVSHDLRTPLTGILGNSDILLRKEEQIEPDLRKQLYKSIYDDSEWLIDLVENLLFVTRVENGVMSIRTAPEVLQEIIPETVRSLAKRISGHNLSLEMPEAFLVVKIDARLFTQMLINIVDNAVKYTPEGTDITIKAFQRDGFAVVEVADTGPGISDEDKQKVFQMFYTTNKKNDDSRRGIGLGLSLCQSIAEAHGGSIRIRDNTPSGAVVSVTLNLEEVCRESEHLSC